MDPKKRDLFSEKMESAGLPRIAIEAFLRGLDYVAAGGATTIGEAEIEAVGSLPRLEGLERYAAAGRRAADRCVVIKLNGGLGTGMGLSKAKSLLPVRTGVSFLDLIANQILYLRDEWKTELPLVLMNSFRTHEDSLEALSAHASLVHNAIPLDFIQHKVPRIDAARWEPVEWSSDRELEWCPPGHGDLYIALESSGMLERLLANGIRYAFVSNSDNLGARLDPRILGWFADESIPFAMEVAERTEADKKGGHLARRDGQLILREVAQCRDEDAAAFQDIERHSFFNTNNLWVDLERLSEALASSPSGLPLPVMSNAKNVSVDDPSSPLCYQLETAMGAAIECFDGASALVVSRDRFAPVKTTNDLLLLWSDAYRVTEDARLVPTRADAEGKCLVDLDKKFFGKVGDLEARFPQGAPSLVDCERFVVEGDHEFGAGVVATGSVHLSNSSNERVVIADRTVLGSN